MQDIHFCDVSFIVEIFNEKNNKFVEIFFEKKKKKKKVLPLVRTVENPVLFLMTLGCKF